MFWMLNFFDSEIELKFFKISSFEAKNDLSISTLEPFQNEENWMLKPLQLKPTNSKYKTHIISQELTVQEIFSDDVDYFSKEKLPITSNVQLIHINW